MSGLIEVERLESHPARHRPRLDLRCIAGRYGGTAVLASFASYTLEKRVAGPNSKFGKGAIEGVAGPEAANNAAAQTSFIPMLTLGIPSNPVMALMVGAMIIQGIQPGPQVMTQRPELFWGMIASMWVGNILLVLLNLPLIGIWVRLLKGFCRKVWYLGQNGKTDRNYFKNLQCQKLT